MIFKFNFSNILFTFLQTFSNLLASFYLTNLCANSVNDSYNPFPLFALNSKKLAPFYVAKSYPIFRVT